MNNHPISNWNEGIDYVLRNYDIDIDFLINLEHYDYYVSANNHLIITKKVNYNDKELDRK